MDSGKPETCVGEKSTALVYCVVCCADFECTNSFSLTLFTSSAYKQVKGYKQIPETEKKNKR